MTPKANEIQFTVNLETNVLDRLKSMAEYASLSRHKLMVNILQVGIEQLEVLENVGIFQIGILIRNMTESPEKAIDRKHREAKNSEMPIPLRIEKNLVERLERLADRGDLTRQRLAQNIIKVGIEEIESGKKYGLTQAAIKFRDVQEMVQDLFTDILEVGKQAFYAGREVKTK
jgi:predicted DNA-binding protein